MLQEMVSTNKFHYLLCTLLFEITFIVDSYMPYSFPGSDRSMYSPFSYNNPYIQNPPYNPYGMRPGFGSPFQPNNAPTNPFYNTNSLGGAYNGGSFGRGIESGFGSFPGYPITSATAQRFFPHPYVGPNNYGGYGFQNSYRSGGFYPPGQISGQNPGALYGNGNYQQPNFGGPAPNFGGAVPNLGGPIISESMMDKDNFQPRGCTWVEGNHKQCSDSLGICRGGCQDFSRDLTGVNHDCRCVPIGYNQFVGK